PGVAIGYALEGLPESHKQTVLIKCVQSILGASRRIPAFGAHPGRNYNFVKPYQQYKRKDSYLFTYCFKGFHRL
ncbi:MAG: hypothetical protein RLZZ172_1383, partial [Bacteroidota bacterium]